MKWIMVLMGMMWVACGMPNMPEHVPLSERHTPAANTGTSQDTAGSANAVNSGTSGSATPSSAVSGTSASTVAPASANPAAAPKPPSLAKVLATPVVLNEILYDLPGDDTNGDLFVELRGTPGGDLGGYKISFINGDDGKETENITVPAGLLVPNDGLFVIADGITGDLQHTHVANADVLDNFDPQNGPDSVQLLSPEGKLVDAVSYGSPKLSTAANGLAMLEGTAAPDAALSQSVSRLPDAEDSNDNSMDFVVNTIPSPGAYDVVEAP